MGITTNYHVQYPFNRPGGNQCHHSDQNSSFTAKRLAPHPLNAQCFGYKFDARSEYLACNHQTFFPSDPAPTVLQWNAGGFRARSVEPLHFISSHPVHLTCIQESNPNSTSSNRIPRFSALRSNLPHSRSGTLSTNHQHASGDVTVFVLKGLSSFKRSLRFRQLLLCSG